MTTFNLPPTEEAIARLDNLFATAFSSDDKAMQDYVAFKFALKELSDAKAAMDETVAPDPSKPLAQRIRDEFHDFRMIVSHCEEIYDHASGGIISKAQTLPSEVISLLEARIDKAIKEGA